MKKLNKTTLWWIVGLLIFTGISILIYSSFSLRLIGHWALIVFGLSTVAIIIYSFVGSFFKKNCYKCIATAIIAVLSILGYLWYKEGLKTVKMKEDVLYIVPKSRVQEKEIYDGSKNDPNLKQDTI